VKNRFIWHRTNFVLAESEVEIRWWIPKDVLPGSYRIRHAGHHKQLLLKQVQYYEGSTNNFFVRQFVDIEK
jgi:neutral ceramidase